MATTKTRRPKDAEECASGLHRQIRSFESKAASEDPWAAAEMLKMAAELEDAAVRTVARLREAGYTWTDIGFSMGLSKAACHNRFAPKIAKLAQEAS